MSTAYSHATSDRAGAEVREQFYTSPVPADTLLKLVDTVDEKRLNTITERSVVLSTFIRYMDSYVPLENNWL